MTFMRKFASVAVLLLLAGNAIAEEKIDFDRQIKPILSDRCFVCHGPDGNRREADLRLDTREGAYAAAESGNRSHVIKPGEPENSELLLRVTAAPDDDLLMPPADSNLTLTAEEKRLLKQWIQQGAPWSNHWSFEPLPAKVEAPVVKDKTWPQNKIDAFVLSRLEQAGLEPAPRATREKLIRRVSFDITGIPPTLEEIDAFLADEQPGAFERVVDRLLKSPRYGERMTADWLDAARYSDTFGYQVDRDRRVWPWRDWVLQAFNNNMPYSDFITQQLAGDLLPGATQQQILATTFNRLHPQKVEGGSVPEEFRVEYVADRMQTFSTAMLGVTMECCRCHDHKYDPFSQKEYYQLFAFFNTIDEAGLYSYFTQSTPTPTLALYDDATSKRLAAAKQKLTVERRALAELQTTEQDNFNAWLNNRPAPADEMPGRIAMEDFEKSGVGGNAKVDARGGKAVKLTGDDGFGLKVGNFKRDDPFSVSLWMNTPDLKERAVVFHRSRAWTDAASRGYQLLIEDGRLSASLIHFWPGNAIRIRTKETVEINKWLHVAFVYDGSSQAAGLKLYLNGQPAATEVVRDNLYRNITGGGDNITIGQRFRDKGFTGGMVDDFMVFDRQLSGLEVAHLHDGKALDNLLTAPAGELTQKQRDQLFQHYLLTQSDNYTKQFALTQVARKQVSAIENAVVEIMAMREMDQPRKTYLLHRGAYDKPRDEVTASTPDALLPFPAKGRKDRLGLAQWMTDPAHPLTARVAVNRLWQMLTGKGLVTTPEDFGRQGKAPTHPQLLDWLARDFVASGWDVKRAVKQIVMSATYQQSTTGRPASVKADPENKLLARADSFRLPAEMLRDNALAVSGLLVEKQGGPPVRPYELALSFKPVKPDKGAGLYRRSLYTYWKRTGPAPVMMTLDAAKRDVCRVRRERTASPLESLVLMNGPQFVEAARMLAQKSLQAGEEAPAALTRIFRTLTSRQPTSKESAIVKRLFEQQLEKFEKNPAEAKKFLSQGEAKPAADIPPARLAAMAVVASALMNFDECVTRR